MRYFIYISYAGTNYCGWQVQPNGVSIQEMVEKALSTILQYEVNIVGAGRTDAGVHARLMVAHFDAYNLNLTGFPIDRQNLTAKLNSLLPKDIAVQRIVPVIPEAHARFDAVSRTYEYWVTCCKNPFLNDWAARVRSDIDFGKMNQAAEILLHHSDFTSFSKLHTDVKTNNCNIAYAKWIQNDEKWVFCIQADRFLRNMVRAIVGTLFEVGNGKISIEDFETIIRAKDRCKAGTSAPAKGLYLVDVLYPATVFEV